jgi:hypothetical protein
MALAFVLGSISKFFAIKLVELSETMTALMEQKVAGSALMPSAFSFTQIYNASLYLLFIPIFALFTRSPFQSLGFNY